MEIELVEYGDGTKRLYFEDRINGADWCIVLGDDGKAYQEKYADTDIDAERPYLVEIDLVAFLRSVAQ